MSSQIEVEPIFNVVLPESELTKFEREKRAFYRLAPGLAVTHYGQYVAIHNEEVVDSGPVRVEVVFRALRLARSDIFVGLVSVEPEPPKHSGIRRIMRDWTGRP